MPKFFKMVSKKAGLPPGMLVHIGKKKMDKPRITSIDFDSKHMTEKELKRIEDVFKFRDTSTTTWINIDGIHETEIIEKIGKHFSIHPLVLEDIANTGQRPKVEDLDSYLFCVLKMLSYDEKEDEVNAEQISLILGRKYVITFQERVGDIFDQLRERIRKGKLRFKKPDYLAYAIIDSVVDNYFVILEKIGERLERLEEELSEKPSTETLHTIHRLKREAIFIRKSVWPLREVANSLAKSDSKMVSEETKIYFKDVYDHTIQVIDTIETFRDMLSGLLDLYLSSISNRMNEVMKVLTIIATIFIPLTFVAGIYGMNFRHMPELDWIWGYPAVWLVIGVIVLLMLIFFKRKEWV